MDRDLIALRRTTVHSAICRARAADIAGWDSRTVPGRSAGAGNGTTFEEAAPDTAVSGAGARG
ncbi:hypothetical protein ACFVXE_04650 [Streptomyces sp. NPDC058231]|uniref:hypothetical protein n=1 Tax=Streptomyces sp. NPDC058231 TaxID=3346392 RepID=UPI0036EA0274